MSINLSKEVYLGGRVLPNTRFFFRASGEIEGDEAPNVGQRGEVILSLSDSLATVVL